MSINNLYITTVDYHWKDASIKLLDKGNLNQALILRNLVDYHTTIDDITTQNLQKVCQSANKIHLVDIDLNTVVQQDYKNNDQYSYGRLFYELIKVRHKVQNFDFIDGFNLDKFDNLDSVRATDDPVLWTIGCSFTAGEGVTNEQRYGYLLGKQLNRPEITLSRNGASQAWAADQLLRSDVRANDIVVWGLTNIQRFEYALDWDLYSMPAARYNQIPKELRYWPLEYFDSTTMITQSVRKVLQVMNFCSKINAKLYLVNLYDITWMSTVLKDNESFLDLTKDFPISECLNKYFDIGTDGLHPGPITQKWYSEQIYNFIKEK